MIPLSCRDAYLNGLCGECVCMCVCVSIHVRARYDDPPAALITDTSRHIETALGWVAHTETHLQEKKTRNVYYHYKHRNMKGKRRESEAPEGNPLGTCATSRQKQLYLFKEYVSRSVFLIPNIFYHTCIFVEPTQGRVKAMVWQWVCARSPACMCVCVCLSSPMGWEDNSEQRAVLCHSESHRLAPILTQNVRVEILCLFVSQQHSTTKAEYNYIIFF